MAVSGALGVYAAKSWYYWARSPSIFGPTIGELPFGVGDIGAAVLFLAAVCVSYWLCFMNPRASNFLIEVEIELRKVTWPSVKPWLSTKSEVWASTYVVLAVVVILVFFVFVVDRGLSALSQWVFY